MRITNSRIVQKDGVTILSAKIESVKFSKDLWFSTPAKYAEHLCIELMDCFLVGMLYFAMVNGENIHVDGRVSKRLLFNINSYLIPYLIQYSPKLKPVRVTSSQGEYCMFSGGG